MMTQRGRARSLVALSAPFATSLALHTLLGPRNDCETRDRNAVAARHAQAICAVLHASKRAFDVVDGLAGGGRERKITFALDAYRVTLARLLVELRVALFTFVGELFGFGQQFLSLSR